MPFFYRERLFRYLNKATLPTTIMTKDLVFIVSGGRTATALFGEMLSQCVEDCVSIHEPDLINRNVKKTLNNIRNFGLWHVIFGRILNRTGARVIGQKFILNKISDNQVKNYIIRSRQAYFGSIAASLVVESNGQWWALTDHLAQVWPTARIIMIIRDPRDWIRSWINKSGRYDQYDLVELFPPGRLTPQKVRDVTWTSQWSSFTTLEKLAWEWSYINRRLLESYERGGNKRLFRFEDIFSNNRSHLIELVNYITMFPERTYRIIDMDNLAKTVSNSSSGPMPHWKNWDANSARSINMICGTLMKRFGYGEEEEWKKLVTKDDDEKSFSHGVS